MPLPKIPTEPAAILLAKDYPRAEPGKSPVRAAAKAENDPVEDLISGQAVEAKPARARKSKTAMLAEAPARESTPPAAPATLPGAERLNRNANDGKDDTNRAN